MSRPRPIHEQRFQNRKGPGGIDLDPTEAIAWFPPLDDAPAATQLANPRTLDAGCSALLSCNGVRFWVYGIETSLEAGWYFGNIEAFPKPWNEPDEKYYDLGPNQNIGFEMRHVLEVQSSGSDHVPAVRP